MPSGSRRSHTKSRNGCGQCKKRRKRCDGKPPQCANCQRWGIACDYTVVSKAVEQIANRFFFTPSDPAINLGVFPPLPFFDERHLRLLKHYTAYASLTISTEITLPIWRGSVLEEAKDHLFLMHSLLAISALHLYHVHNGEWKKYVNVANNQHEQALACFRTSVGSINCGNGNAVTAFSFLTVVFSLGLPVVLGFTDTPDPTSAFTDILQVLRQAWCAMDSVLRGVEKGPLGMLVRNPPTDAAPCDMHPKGLKVMKALKRYNDNSNDSEGNKAIYREALAQLQQFLIELRDSPPTWANSLSWLTSVSDAFFQHLQQKRTFPLILLAHWCIPVYRALDMWFNVWAKHIVTDIWNTLEGDAKEAIRWPAEQIGIIPWESHPQYCLCLKCLPLCKGQPLEAPYTSV